MELGEHGHKLPLQEPLPTTGMVIIVRLPGPKGGLLLLVRLKPFSDD
jgi:hypothetical protein